MAKTTETVGFFSAYIKVILEIILVLPVLYLFSLIVIDDSHRFIILGSMALYPIVGVLSGKIFGSNKVLRFIFGFIVSAIVGTAIMHVYLTGVGEIVFNYIMALVLFYRGMMYTGGEWIDLLPSTAVFVIITLDFIALLIIGIAPALEPYIFPATITGPFIIILAIFIMNYLNMKQLSDTRSTVSKSGKLAVDRGMNIHNRLWVGIVFIAVLLVSTWQNMINALQYIAEKILWLIMKLMDGGEDTSASGSTGSESDTIRDLMAAEEHASNPFWEKFIEILTVVLSIIFVIVIATLIIIIIYKLIKAISALMKELMDKESSLIDDMGYVDSRESIMNLKDAPREYLKKLKSRIEDLFAREPKYSDMKTAEQKSTWLYRHTVIKSMSAGYKYKMSNTATETLNEIKPNYVGNKNDIDFIDDAYNKVKFSKSLPDLSKLDDLGNSK